jgi:hypothetical protein
MTHYLEDTAPNLYYSLRPELTDVVAFLPETPCTFSPDAV